MPPAELERRERELDRAHTAAVLDAALHLLRRLESRRDPLAVAADLMGGPR